MFGDIDYSDYVSESSQSTLEMIRSMLDEAMYKYLAVLLAQPFDVAKTILQVRTQALTNGTEPVSAAKNGKKERSDFMDSRYADVCSSWCEAVCHMLMAMIVPLRRFGS